MCDSKSLQEPTGEQVPFRNPADRMENLHKGNMTPSPSRLQGNAMSLAEAGNAFQGSYHYVN